MNKYQLKRLSFKLYLEGIEIPFRSLTVSHNDTTTFNINIPPYYEAFHLKPNTNAVIVYRRTKMEEWKMLAEGVYIGNGYSKRPRDRTITLKFKDIKWFYDNSKLYDIIRASKAFAPLEAAFFGDLRMQDASFKEKKLESTYALGPRSEFLTALEGDEPITNSINYILQKMLVGNDFLAAYAPKYKLDDGRFKIIENNDTKEIFKLPVLQSIYNEILNESTTMTRVIDLIYSLAQIIQYDLKPVPGMIKSDPKKSYVMKPHLQFTTPPACNVIFPDENTSFNYQKDETQIPTRFRLVDNIHGTENQGYYAPSEIFDDFATNSDTREGLTDEEKFKGIIPRQETMPISQTLSIGFTEGTLQEAVMSKASFVNYLYYKEKYKTVPLSVEVAFKPDILPGFPALIMDKEIPLIGYLISATHNINPESGYATTTLTLSHVRTFDETFPQLAGWYDTDQFGVDNIGDYLYSQLDTQDCFGHSEVNFTPKADEISGMVSLKDGILQIQKAYENAEDRVSFQNEFSRKETTFKEYRDAMDIDLEDGQLTGGPYDIDLKIDDGAGPTVSEERRRVVKILKKRMNSTSPRRFSKEDE